MPGPMRIVEPLEKGAFTKNLKKLIAYMKPYYLVIALSVVVMSTASVLSIIAPNYLSDLTNELSTSIYGFSIDMSVVLNVTSILIILYLSNALCHLVSGIIMNIVNQRTCKSLRRQISRKINNLPLKYFDSHPYGDTLSRVTNDVDTIGNALQQSITMVCQSVITLVGVLIAMFVSSWQMTLSVLISVPLILVILFGIVGLSQPHFRRQQAKLGTLNGQIEESYTGHIVVKAFCAENMVKESFQVTNEQLKNATFLSGALSGIMMPAMDFVSKFAYAAVCVCGGLLLVNNLGVTYGTITAFLVYVNLFQSPLSQIGQAMNTLQSAAAASGRVFEFLEESELDDEFEKTAKLENGVKGNVEFVNVKFGYDKDKIIIPNFSASIKAGSKVAIVGPTGAGKTTMVNLLMRFYEMQGGDITIDGVSIKDMKMSDVRDLFGMVLQDTWMFEGTLKENILYGKNVSDENLKKICEAAKLDHYISTLADGLDYYLDDGDDLSGGQKQLITIARAMAENAPMLILDEATSNVDTRTEELIQVAMDTLCKGRTSFVIAHRLSTIRNADLILVMNGGNIVETGSHDELISKGGFYAELYNSQFAN